jgi:hypothetical protein
MRKITTKKLEKLLHEPESEYLDFKEDYSDKNKNCALIKDILSMANSRTKQKDRFLIFGVTDGGVVCGVKASDRRKKQADIIDLLHNAVINKNLELKLYTLFHGSGEIDILHLHVEDLSEQPYFLKKGCSDGHEEKGERLLAGILYERVGDTNRPIVDDIRLDEIYRRRFGLDRTPLERCHIYLKNKGGWQYGYNEKNALYFYYTQHPEFTILLPADKEHETYEDPWANNFFDPAVARRQVMFVKYHSTILQTFVGVWSDGGKYLTVSPERWYWEDQKSGNHYFAYYFLNDSIRSILNNMIQEVYTKKTNVQSLFFQSFPSAISAGRAFRKDLMREQRKYMYFYPEHGKYRSINGYQRIQ